MGLFSSPEPKALYTHVPESVVVHPFIVHNVQTSSSPKSLAQSKPNFVWSLYGKGEQKFAASGSPDQDGHHAHIW